MSRVPPSPPKPDRDRLKRAWAPKKAPTPKPNPPKTSPNSKFARECHDTVTTSFASAWRSEPGRRLPGCLGCLIILSAPGSQRLNVPSCFMKTIDEVQALGVVLVAPNASQALDAAVGASDEGPPWETQQGEVPCLLLRPPLRTYSAGPPPKLNQQTPHPSPHPSRAEVWTHCWHILLTQQSCRPSPHRHTSEALSTSEYQLPSAELAFERMVGLHKPQYSGAAELLLPNLRAGFLAGFILDALRVLGVLDYALTTRNCSQKIRTVNPPQSRTGSAFDETQEAIATSDPTPTVAPQPPNAALYSHVSPDTQQLLPM